MYGTFGRLSSVVPRTSACVRYSVSASGGEERSHQVERGSIEFMGRTREMQAGSRIHFLSPSGVMIVHDSGFPAILTGATDDRETMPNFPAR